MPKIRSKKGSGEDFRNDSLLFHTRQTLVKALISEGKTRVIDAHAVHNGGVKVIDVARILDNVVAEIISGAEDRSAANPASGQPHTEITWMVVPTVICRCQCPL